MSKKIVHKSSFGEKIKLGIDQVADIVSETLGPGGRTILLERQGVSPTGDPLTPMITKDGVSVALECQSEDPEIDVVIQTVKAICSKTNRIAGDGTTTAIVLGRAILDEALNELSADSQLNPQDVRRAIEASSQNVVEQLKSAAIPVKDPKMISDVATISANGNRDIGEIIREAFDAVGAEGVITVDEGTSARTTLEVVDGFQIRRGAEAQDRFFNNAEKTRFEADRAYVILYDGKLNSYTDILPPLNAVAKATGVTGKGNVELPPIVVVANDFSSEVIQFLLIQRAELGMKVCAVKSPHTTTVRTSILDDMAVLLNGYRFGNGNRDLISADPEKIGRCDRVVIDKYTATFYGGDGEEEKVLERVNQLKELRKIAESPYDAALISDRIAALSQGVAKIGVGGSTDLEVKELYHRIEDALNAARAAVDAGIIPGGGITMARIGDSLDSTEDIGNRILKKALMAPLKQIINNLGLNHSDSSQLIFNLMEEQGHETTFDGHDPSFPIVNALEAGIVDPVKVARTALENAVSIAALLATCGGAIVFNRPN